MRGEPVASDVGMTGEITLTGQVLPIGGLREKSLAAQRAGLKRVIFPRENEPDLEELPPEARDAIEFIPADTIEDVFAAAFTGGAREAAAPARGRSRGRYAENDVTQRLAVHVALRRGAPAEQLVLALAAEDERVLHDVLADRQARSCARGRPPTVTVRDAGHGAARASATLPPASARRAPS